MKCVCHLGPLPPCTGGQISLSPPKKSTSLQAGQPSPPPCPLPPPPPRSLANPLPLPDPSPHPPTSTPQAGQPMACGGLLVAQCGHRAHKGRTTGMCGEVWNDVMQSDVESMSCVKSCSMGMFFIVVVQVSTLLAVRLECGGRIPSRTCVMHVAEGDTWQAH